MCDPDVFERELQNHFSHVSQRTTHDWECIPQYAHECFGRFVKSYGIMVGSVVGELSVVIEMSSVICDMSSAVVVFWVDCDWY